MTDGRWCVSLSVLSVMAADDCLEKARISSFGLIRRILGAVSKCRERAFFARYNFKFNYRK